MEIFDCVLGAMAIVFPIYIVSSIIGSTKKRSEKAKELAISKRQVVTAHRIKMSLSIYGDPAAHTSWSRNAVYEYTYKGKKYKYRIVSSDPPERITLYFLKDPRKARVSSVLYDSDICWPMIGVAVAALLYWLMYT